MNSFGAEIPVSSISTIAFERNGKRERISSYDRTGGNDDRLHIQPGENCRIAEIRGAGCITHIWVTIANEDTTEEENYLRKIVLRMYWDGEDTPSVEAPIGDFFGMGHAQCRNFVSVPLQMSPENGKAFNCWFPMPFSSGARIEILNECMTELLFYYYVDYEEQNALPDGLLRFHALWHRECPTLGISDTEISNREYEFGGKNISMPRLGANHFDSLRVCRFSLISILAFL